jgi:hypothetical protein
LSALGGVAAVALPPRPTSVSASPAQRCFVDGMIQVFAFLPLTDCLCAASTCSGWYLSAARRFRSAPQLLALRNPSDRGRALLLQSSSRMATVVSVSDYRANTPYHLNEWRRLARCCPNLLAMDMPLHVDWQQQQQRQQEQLPSYSLAGAFPPSLRCLRICVPFQRNVVDLHDQLLEAICIEAPLLRRLALIFPQTFAQVDLNALLRLKDSLTDLHIARAVSGAPRIDVLRQLHFLRKLDVGRGAWDLTDLALLCRPGHQLTQLQKLVVAHEAGDGGPSAPLAVPSVAHVARSEPSVATRMAQTLSHTHTVPFCGGERASPGVLHSSSQTTHCGLSLP